MFRVLVALPLGLFLAACSTTDGAIFRGTGERELRPPRAGIEVGSLYYVRETPTDDLTRPANLERLCSVKLSSFGIAAKEKQRVADIDLLSKLDADGSLEGIKLEFVSLGLNGAINDYFEFKLTNVLRTDISYDEADKIFKERAFRRDCTHWRGNINGNNWGIYQIQSISEGDVSLSMKSGWNIGGEVSAKLQVFEPKLKAAIKRANQVGYSGKGLVATFGPIPRNVPR